MAQEKKTQIIDELQEQLSKCSVGILTDYRGLTTAEITGLRRQLREAGITYRVVKNTLARFAAERSGRNDLANLFDGPVAIAFGYDDIVEPAKVLANYIRTAKSTLSIKSGFLSDGLLTSEDLETLATLPSKEVLIAKLLSAMRSPIVILISVLSSPMRGFMGVIQARIEQLEGE